MRGVFAKPIRVMTSSLRFDFSVSPWMVDLLTHLWQSTVVAAVILLLVGLTKGLSARTRSTLGWIAVAKFFLPVAWLVSLVTPEGGASASRALVLPVTLVPVTVSAENVRGDIPVPALLALVWIMVALGLLACWIGRATRTRRRLLAAAKPAPVEIAQRVADAATRVGLHKVPRCVVVASEHGPGLVGVFAPVLILPRGLAEALSAPELDAILIHECVHQQRHDNGWSALRAVFVALFWFNPIAWMIHRSIGLETEKACDERVLEVTGDSDSYARGIVAAVRHGLGLVSAGFSGATTPPVLSRVRDILTFSSRRERPLVRCLVLIAGIALVGLSGGAGSIAADASKPAPQPARYKVGTITIKFVGPANVDERFVRDVMQLRTGEAFDEVLLDRDIRAIYRTGKFRTIEVKHTPVDGTTFNLVVELTPKPADGTDDSTPSPSPQPAPALSERPVDPQTTPEELNDARRKRSEANERLKKLQAARAEALVRKKERDAALEASVASPSVVSNPGSPEVSSNARPVVSAAPPETSATKPVYDISALDQKPVARFQARPRYPFEMRRAGIAGEAVVDFVVTDKGDVVNAFAIRSSRVEFEAAAVEAVSKWKFRPGVKGGQDVNTHMQVPIVFTLNE